MLNFCKITCNIDRKSKCSAVINTIHNYLIISAVIIISVIYSIHSATLNTSYSLSHSTTVVLNTSSDLLILSLHPHKMTCILSPPTRTLFYQSSVKREPVFSLSCHSSLLSSIHRQNAWHEHGIGLLDYYQNLINRAVI